MRKLEAAPGRLILVADPDDLLLEERMLQLIDVLGFDLFTFDDPVAFRFAFESRRQSLAESGGEASRRILIRVSASEPDMLPYDLLMKGHSLSFGLASLFPELSYPVVASLDRVHLDALLAAQQQAPLAQRLGEKATRYYVLRHVFGVAPEMITREEHLLRFLLRRHYRGLRIPSDIDGQLVELLEKRQRLRAWPLANIIPDREAFFAFLQERWPPYLDRMAAPAAARERPSAARYETQIPGPVQVAFDHDDVRIYIDNLFHEGLLKPVPHSRSQRLVGSWAMVGVTTDPSADRLRRMRGLLQRVEETIPDDSAAHREWFDLARRWAELRVLRDTVKDAVVDASKAARYDEVRQRIDEDFAAWLAVHYSTLHNHPPVPPVMLHHVPRHLARRVRQGPDHKVALVLIDGLAWDQWVVVREELKSQRTELRFREDSVFAWIPTLTSVSRQACFAGRPPFYFGKGISSTAGEPAAWNRFWVDEGLTPGAVRFEKKLRTDDDLERVADAVSVPGVRAVALVVDVVDKIVHGETLGSGGMRNQVKYWAEQATLTRILDMLKSAGFSVFLTSDHGNIETRGCGRPADGVLVETYGKRVRVYDDPVLRDRVLEKFPNAVPWRRVGLPEGYHALLAPGRFSFVREDEKPVAHGGASLEEVVVPLVEIEAS